MMMKNTKRWLKIIMPMIAIICTILFTPWILLRAWIAPLPATVQEQVNDAIGYGLDGIIVYVDQAGKDQDFYAAGWNNRENNRSSGAYGIPQALPGNKMASAGADWRTNPQTQINWGLSYIAKRYGTPCDAWQHFLRKHWY